MNVVKSMRLSGFESIN